MTGAVRVRPLQCPDTPLLAECQVGGVLDLGCGGGIDCFIASKQVDSQGRVVGVDMTGEMLARAEKSAEAVGRNLVYRNAEFRPGYLVEVDTAEKFQRPPYAGLFLLTDPTRGVAERACCAPAPGQKGCC